MRQADPPERKEVAMIRIQKTKPLEQCEVNESDMLNDKLPLPEAGGSGRVERLVRAREGENSETRPVHSLAHSRPQNQNLSLTGGELQCPWCGLMSNDYAMLIDHVLLCYKSRPH
jgi:hypothetical protein